MTVDFTPSVRAFVQERIRALEKLPANPEVVAARKELEMVESLCNGLISQADFLKKTNVP